MDREQAIERLKKMYMICDMEECNVNCDLCGEATNLAIKALEREIEYGQMVVDLTKGEKVDDWVYDEDENVTTTDCISRQQAIGAIEGVDWYHINSKGKLVSGSTSDEESWYKAEDIYEALESLKPVMPPGKVLAEIKVDTEEVVERIKEEHQEHGRLIDVDKLLQELFNVDEEEWTTPEIRAILENAPTIITPTEKTGKWAVACLDHESVGARPRTLYCSNCNWLTSFPSAWCPNCGAKMRG